MYHATSYQRLLHYLTETPTALSAGDLSAVTNIPLPTTYRALRRLADRGLVDWYTDKSAVARWYAVRSGHNKNYCTACNRPYVEHE
ncbi:helix-turn-helix domain-containing protein [Jejubacter calystegiae]